MLYSLERFEEHLAVLSDDNGKTVAIERQLLASTAKVGDVFSCADGVYRYEETQTVERRERIKRLEQLLKNR